MEALSQVGFQSWQDGRLHFLGFTFGVYSVEKHGLRGSVMV
jgi:hypothetical protein